MKGCGTLPKLRTKHSLADFRTKHEQNTKRYDRIIDALPTEQLASFAGNFISSNRPPFKPIFCTEKTLLHIECPMCSKYCAHSIPELRKHFESLTANPEHHAGSPFKELTIAELNHDLETTVKKDEATKAITFLDMLVAQTDDDQFNIFFSAESASGKSYLSMEVAKYFPQNEVIELGGASPTAWIHEQGIQVVPVGKETFVPLDKMLQPLTQEKNLILESLQSMERNSIQAIRAKTRLKELKRQASEILSESKTLVDFANKIVIFLDQPNTQFLAKIRPLLSHDKKIVDYAFTDRNKSGLKTRHVLIRGFPSVFFCSTVSSYDEQEGTRVFVLSPETDSEKLGHSISLLTDRLSDKEMFREFLRSQPNRRNVMFRIELIRTRRIRKIAVRFDLARAIEKAFRMLHPSLAPRHTRDYVRIFDLVFGHALLNCFSHECKNDDTIYATLEDAQAAFDLYTPIVRANESGVSPGDYAFFANVLSRAYSERPQSQTLNGKECEVDGVTLQQLSSMFFRVHKRDVGSRRLESMMKALRDAGLVFETKHPLDGRKIIYKPAGIEQAMPEKVKVEI